MSNRYNVTRSGKCPECGVTMTATGLGSDVNPLDMGHQLGDTAEFPCGMCGHALTMTLVAISLAPFVAQPDEDDNEPCHALVPLGENDHVPDPAGVHWCGLVAGHEGQHICALDDLVFVASSSVGNPATPQLPQDES